MCGVPFLMSQKVQRKCYSMKNKKTENENVAVSQSPTQRRHHRRQRTRKISIRIVVYVLNIFMVFSLKKWSSHRNGHIFFY